ncbi:uncharacterized protein V1513DRAFT_423309 [Lipomyces chichibuensis]|uniref:uncharacterized protein n=1 Tax=Lipomyces chichibuensis TaxID=1546026 RepID=UPI0033433930
MSTATEDFPSHHRQILAKFTNVPLNIATQENDFKEWTTRSSIALGSGGSLRSPRRKIQSMSVDCSNPAAIEVELKDFKELFSKLKVTYLEQETKETFLRAILDVDDDDDDDDDDDEKKGTDEASERKDLRMWKVGQLDLDEATQRNIGLKQVLVDKKKALQNASNEIAALVEVVCDKYEILKTEISEAEEMLHEIESMQAELRELEKDDEESDKDVHQTLSLKETLGLYGKFKAQESELDDDIRELTEVIILEKKRELEKFSAELVNLSELSNRLEEAAKIAIEARKVEMNQGKIIAKENIGLWYSNVLLILKRLLYVDDVHVDPLTEQITLSFKNSKNRSHEVKLAFSKGRFYNATMIYPASLDISRAVDRAVQFNDIRYLMEELKRMVEL